MTVWMTVREAADYSRFSPDIVRQAVKAGDLPSYAPTPGRKDVRLKDSDIDAWIESRPYEPRSA